MLVNRTRDRSSIIGARNVFHNLYPKKYFQEWRVFQVFELVELTAPRVLALADSSLDAQPCVTRLRLLNTRVRYLQISM